MQVAVRVEQQPLALERARHRPVIAVGDHVGVVQVHERLAAQDRFLLDAIEEELAHELFLARAEADLLLERLVVQHRVGEPQHVEDDVEILAARPGEDVLAVRHVGGEERRGDAELEVVVLLRQRLHGLDGLAGLLEAVLHVPDLVVDVADAVERDADAQQEPLLGAELDDRRQQADGANRRQARRVDPDLAQAGKVALEHLHHLRQVVPRRRLAAGDVQVLDRAPEGRVHHRLELRQRHVRLAVAELPVVAHLALGVADPGAVIDEDRRADRVKPRADEGIDEVAGDARCRFGEVPGAGRYSWPCGKLPTSVTRGEVRRQT